MCSRCSSVSVFSVTLILVAVHTAVKDSCDRFYLTCTSSESLCTPARLPDPTEGICTLRASEHYTAEETKVSVSSFLDSWRRRPSLSPHLCSRARACQLVGLMQTSHLTATRNPIVPIPNTSPRQRLEPQTVTAAATKTSNACVYR